MKYKAMTNGHRDKYYNFIHVSYIGIIIGRMKYGALRGGSRLLRWGVRTTNGAQRAPKKYGDHAHTFLNHAQIRSTVKLALPC